jgi:hypothetical protein
MNQPRINLFLLAAVALLLVDGRRGPAQVVVNREAELKAKLVASLGKLVTWPSEKAPSAMKPLKIGIVGDDPFVDANGVDHLKGNVPNAKIFRFATAAEFEDCHILVVAKNADLKATLAKAQGLPILVVTESTGIARQGAAITLVRQNNRIRVEINAKAVRDAGLLISRGLLQR